LTAGTINTEADARAFGEQAAQALRELGAAEYLA
jgi:hypothetical protein